MRLFVTGIGTDVGKTLAAAILTEALEADYWKPIQSGNIQTEDAMTVWSLISNNRTHIHKEAYSFREPVSPHLAAALENTVIDTDAIKCPVTDKHLVIEGAGGILVPLNDKDFVIDLAKRFDAEVILVIRNYLGCINHSLLSIDYLRQHHYKLKGLVLNGDFDADVKRIICAHAAVPVIVEIPELPEINKETVKRYAESLHLQEVLL